ncbi:tetratricopeptide repeat protein [Effusibacillus dendaii]|uniref:Tetratricopeptide repeat protein n=1 Tax=Effusibacillus dendaii TaxID=2743772 RepID=A0A7I8DA64_9BACL|nr:tetratricopeptide repeat protein [Effusibacillus dendaii]BCJ86985.1 hypothetical protein skT53_19700 [Effusibacillus dendaii]
MNLHLLPKDWQSVREKEHPFDSCFTEMLDELGREDGSLLNTLVLFESMKQQVVELAEIRIHRLLERDGSTFVDEDKWHIYDISLLQLKLKFLASESTVETDGFLFLFLSMTYYRLGYLEEAKDSAILARKHYNGTEDDRGLVFIDYLLAVCCAEMEQWEEAQDWCLMALYGGADDTHTLFSCIWQLYGLTFQRQSKTEQAVAAYLMAYESWRKQGVDAKQVQTALSLSLVLSQQKDWMGAIHYLKKVFPVCCEPHMWQLKLEVLHMLKHLFAKTGQTGPLLACEQQIERLAYK